MKARWVALLFGWLALGAAAQPERADLIIRGGTQRQPPEQ